MPRLRIKFSLLICLSFLLIFCTLKLWTNSWNVDNILQKHVGINFQKQTDCYNVQMVNKTIDGSDGLEDYIDVCGRLNTIDWNQISSQLCPSCRFKSPVFVKEHIPFIALASIPGSGNSWTRELLESITGIYTGSIYEDKFGRFEGSRRCPLRGDVYIIKTHEYNNKIMHSDCKAMHATTIDYQKAMLILRNPYDAMLSTFNLISTKDKVGFARRDQFGDKKWRTYVRASAKGWRTMNLYWLTKFEKPLHVIVYEDLKTRTITELFNAGRFLNLKSTYLDLFCAKHCLKPKYYRDDKPEWMTKSVLFDDETREVVNSEITELLNEIQGRENIEQTLKSYIMKTNTIP